jgi:hypothetical protein
MWVSRFSIPFDAGRKDVLANLDFALETSDEGGGFRTERYELGHRLSVLRDDNSIRTDGVQQRETFLLELRGGNRLGIHGL